jgi:hypothetical protein
LTLKVFLKKNHTKNQYYKNITKYFQLNLLKKKKKKTLQGSTY